MTETIENKIEGKTLKQHLSKCWFGYLVGFTGYGMIVDGLINKTPEEVYAGLGVSALGGLIGSWKDTNGYKK